MKQNLLCRLVGLLFVPTLATAQTEHSLLVSNPMPVEGSVALSRDYQCIGINPANLGIYPTDYEVPIVTLGLLDASGMFYSDALTRSDILPSLFRGKQLTEADRRDLAQKFATNGHLMSATLMPAGLCVQFPRFMALAFSWQERLTGDVVLSEPFADLLFNGLESTYIDTIMTDIGGQLAGLPDTSLNFYELFNGSHIHYSWLRDYALAGGFALFTGPVISLYAGGAVKFIQSNAYVDVNITEDTITGFAAFSSLFNINYANLTDPNVQLGGRFAPVGRGLGIDAGLTLKVGRSLLLSGAVTDIGKITYNGNLVSVNQTLSDSLLYYLGLNYATVFSDFKNIFNAPGLFQYLPAETVQTGLPTTLRLGLGWYMSDDVRLGLSMMQPVSATLGYWSAPRFSGVLDMLVIPQLKLSAGLQFDGRQVLAIPAGVAFSLTPRSIWQISLGTGDLISVVRQNRPTLSARLALLRFHFN